MRCTETKEVIDGDVMEITRRATQGAAKGIAYGLSNVRGSNWVRTGTLFQFAEEKWRAAAERDEARAAVE